MAFVQYNNRRRCILILIICDALVYIIILYIANAFIFTGANISWRLQEWKIIYNNNIAACEHAYDMGAKNKRVAAVSRH